MQFLSVSVRAIVFTAFVGGWLIACEMVVDLDIPEEPPRLVVNYIIGVETHFAGDIRLSQSQSVLENVAIQPVSGAMITLQEEGNCMMIEKTGTSCIITFEEVITPGFYFASIYPSAGKTYTLRVEKEGFESVEATTFIPLPVEIKQVTYDTTTSPSASHSQENIRVKEIRLTFDDPVEERNYYEVSVEGYEIISSNSYSPFYMFMNSDDPAIVDSNYGLQQGNSRIYGEVLPFSDDLFNGKTYTLRINPNAYLYGDSLRRELTVRLKTISEEQYAYTYANWLQNAYEDIPHIEPVLVPGNLKNGYGIFAGYSFDEVNIRFD